MQRSALVFGVALGAVIAAAAFALGCPPSDLGASCRFAGDDQNACGKCIATSCQAKVNDCCNDDLCAKYEISPLDDCASGKGCQKLFAPTSGKIGAIAGCVRASCADACGGPDSGVSGVITCERVDGGGCRCESSSQGTPSSTYTTCSPTSDTTYGTCCGFHGWPAPDASCLCLPVRCLEQRQAPHDCVCGLLASDSTDYFEVSSCTPSSSSSSGGSATCCKKAGACSCNGRPCGADETAVKSCSASDVAKTIGCDAKDEGAHVDRCR